MRHLSVTSFSLREQLGPLYLSYTDADGKKVNVEWPNPRLHAVSDFPLLARERLGVESVETTTLQFDGIDDPQIELFGESVRAAGMRFLNVCINSGDLLEPDPDGRAEAIAANKRWIEKFAGMGADFVRVNPGSPASSHFSGGDAPPVRLVDALGELGEFARQHGSRLLVENHGGDSSNPVWLRTLLELVGDDCGLLLDLGNFDLVTGTVRSLGFFSRDLEELPDLRPVFDDVDLEPVYGAIEYLADLAELVSLKLNQVDASWMGPVDIWRAMRILRRRGYAGSWSVEYEGLGGDPWWKCRRVLEVASSELSAPLLEQEGGR